MVKAYQPTFACSIVLRGDFKVDMNNLIVCCEEASRTVSQLCPSSLSQPVIKLNLAPGECECIVSLKEWTLASYVPHGTDKICYAKCTPVLPEFCPRTHVFVADILPFRCKVTGKYVRVRLGVAEYEQSLIWNQILTR